MNSITFLNMSGDVTITWDKDNESYVKAMVAAKIKEGYTFFILKKGFIFNKKIKVNDASDIQGPGKMLIPDEAALYFRNEQTGENYLSGLGDAIVALEEGGYQGALLDEAMRTLSFAQESATHLSNADILIRHRAKRGCAFLAKNTRLWLSLPKSIRDTEQTEFEATAAKSLAEVNQAINDSAESTRQALRSGRRFAENTMNATATPLKLDYIDVQDKEVTALARQGLVQVARGSSRDHDTVGRAKSVEEVLRHPTIAVRPIAAG